MPLTQQHRKQITLLYCVLFYILFIYKISNGFLLFQIKPFLFNNRLDLLSFFVMKTGLHQWLLNNPEGWLAFDAVFYSIPLLYWLAYRNSLRLGSIIAVIMFCINFIYIECYTLYPSSSIESFVVWLLFPFLFMTVDLKSFYFVLHGLRYFLLYFFASAAIWKFVQGGIFNLTEMSGILLVHHKEYLATSPTAWYTSFIYWLVNHSFISYCLYVFATFLELFFIAGFFTRKLDKLFMAAFMLFLLADHIVMRIPYWEISPFMLTLLFSKYKAPNSLHT